LNYLTHLKKFQFNIHSFIFINNVINLPLNEDIERTLSLIGNEKYVSSVNYYHHAQPTSCNIYSYSCTNIIEYYFNITNNFPGGLFMNVKSITLYDEYPFEHEFFIQISQSFPIVKRLSLTNKKPQIENNLEESALTVVKFSCLVVLNFDEAHDHYVEQFLFDTKTFIPNNVLLGIEYNQFKRITHNFTKSKTRNNCAKMGYVYEE